jgi:putative phosphoesterase
MKLLALADIHGNFRNIPLLAEFTQGCDAIVIAGDITNFSGKEQAMQVLGSLNRLDKPILAVPGNCDLSTVDECLDHQGANLHAGLIELDGIDFVGAGGSLARPGDEMMFKDILNQAVVRHVPDHELVLVTHQPAWGVVQDTRSGEHTGSRAIRDFIKQHQPVLAVSGHIHEAAGTDRIDATTLVNPGPFRQGYFALIEFSAEAVDVQFKQLKSS